MNLGDWMTQVLQARLHRHLLDPLEDRKLGISAAGLHRPGELRLEGANAEYAVGYFGTPSWVVDRALNALKIDHDRFVFVDLGCGKGRVLLRAARRSFHRVDGVDLSEAMTEAALENIRRAQAAGTIRTRVFAHKMDATCYRLPRQPLILYMFNPFGEPVLHAVLQKLETSLREHPRECYVIYVNPLHRSCLDRSPLLEELPRSRWSRLFDRLLSQWPLAIYRTRAAFAEGTFR
jgi:SAM-dependent methyltransferase